MTCSACGFENPPGFKFCGQCAAALEHRPGSQSHHYTPKHLAEKILTTRAALEGERKQITVLFADVKGSMELAEQLDPEEWHRILDRFFQLLTEGVHRFDGTVNQYTGDGIMALFGAPIAHEDHAQRACFASLHLVEAVGRYARELKREQGLTFSVRIGLNSGEVVVGKIGDDLRMDYTAQGHVVGLAQRMEQLASPDTVYLTGTTAGLVSGYFDLEELGPFAVKGVREPVPVWQLRGAGPMRTRFDVSRARGLTRFVGRDDALRTLEAALARAHEGDGQIVGVVGEAGVGKSRLCYELLQRCRAHGLTVLEGHAVAHGKNIPFLPMLEVFRTYYGITEQDSERAAREKIAGRLLLIDETFRDVLPLVFDFLGVPDPERPAPPMDPDVRQRLLVDVVERLLGRARQTVVTLIEDLHWIDNASDTLLERWVDALAGTRNLLLVTFRPEYQASWMGKPHYQRLSLLPLGPAAIRELLDDLLGRDESLSGLPDVIHARTAGNPFFTEEIVRSLIEGRLLEGSRGHYRLSAPIAQVAVPPTVQAVLAARIDRLPEREKQVLQDAAVIGREFAEPVLAAVTELPAGGLAEALRTLTSAEFIQEQALYPVAEYAFEHPLTQEVAYGTQLTERRRQTHAAAARALEGFHRGSGGEKAALLAYHWECAGDGLAAARWHRRAAEWAGTSHAAQAWRHWQRVLALLAPLPETAETVALQLIAYPQSLNLCWRLGSSEDEAMALFVEGRRLAERAGDPRALAGLSYAWGIVKVQAAQTEEGLGHIAEAARQGEHLDERWRLALRVGLAYANLALGRLREAFEFIESVVRQPPADLRSGARIVGYSPFVALLACKGIVLGWMGSLDEAQRIFERTLELAALDDSDIEVRGNTHAYYSLCARLAGDVPLAAAHVRQALDIAERLGLTRSRVQAYRELGALRVLEGQWHEAVEALEAALAIGQESGIRAYEAFVMADLPDAYLGVGNLARARATAKEAVAVSQRQRLALPECLAHIALARVLVHAAEGANGEIAAALRSAQVLVEKTGANGLQPFIHVEHAALARLSNDAVARQRELREAQRLFTAMGAPIRAEQVARELGA